MKNKILAFATTLALLFAACNNNSTQENNSNNCYQNYSVEHPISEDSIGLDFKANISLMLPQQNKEADQIIYNTLLKSLGGESYQEGSNLEQTVENLYLYQNEEWKKNTSTINNEGIVARWEYIIDMKELPNENNLYGYQSKCYTYFGGAHGISNISYFIFDATTGQQLSNELIYKADSREAINQLLVETFAKKCANDTNLAQNKLAEPTLNNNFYITADGITYCYNQYEIASYAQGIVELTISKEQIEPYLNTESPLALSWNIKK